MSAGGGEHTDRDHDRGGGGYTDDASGQHARDSRYDLATTPAADPTGEAAYERYGDERPRYLDRVTDEQFTRRHCEALAWRELGYSVSGIAKRVDATEGTVRGWLDDWAAEYGNRVLETRPQSDPVGVLE